MRSRVIWVLVVCGLGDLCELDDLCVLGDLCVGWVICCVIWDANLCDLGCVVCSLG